MKKLKLLLVSMVFTATAHGSNGLMGAAVEYTDFLGDTSSSTQIMKKSPLNRGRDMRPKTGLKGIFYFGGSDQKRKLLSSSTQKFLCESRFSSVYSVYDSPKRNTISCEGHAADYIKMGEARSDKNAGHRVRALLENIYEVIKSNGQLGPIYLHCWYGVHASNTIAQIVLKQFCGVGVSQLAHNWDKVDLYDSLGSRGTKKNLQKIYNFEPYGDLQISPAEQQVICH